MSRAISYQSDTAQRVLILTNPTAGSGVHGETITKLRDLLRAGGLQAEITSDLAQIASVCAEPQQANLRAVVAAGGDGTVGEIVNRTPPDTPIAVLPLGTENLLAKYLGMLGGPRDLSQAILHGATVRIDAGQAADRVFVLMAGCGFDADVVQRLHTARTGNIRHFSYVKPIFDSIRNYQYPLLHVECSGVVDPRVPQATSRQRTFSVRWLFVINLPRYAGGLKFAPHAVGTDDLLDVCGFEHGSLANGLRYLAGVLRTEHLKWPDCHYVRAKKVRIVPEYSTNNVLYQLDGDPGGSIPLEIKSLPARIRLVVHETWAVEHGFQHE